MSKRRRKDRLADALVDFLENCYDCYEYENENKFGIKIGHYIQYSIVIDKR